MVIEKGGRCLYDPNRGRISTAFEIAANMQTQRVYKKSARIYQMPNSDISFHFCIVFKKGSEYWKPGSIRAI